MFSTCAMDEGDTHAAVLKKLSYYASDFRHCNIKTDSQTDWGIGKEEYEYTTIHIERPS